MLVPHEWTLNHSRVIVVVVQRQDLGAFCDHRAYRHLVRGRQAHRPFHVISLFLERNIMNCPSLTAGRERQGSGHNAVNDDI